MKRKGSPAAPRAGLLPRSSGIVVTTRLQTRNRATNRSGERTMGFAIVDRACSDAAVRTLAGMVSSFLSPHDIHRCRQRSPDGGVTVNPTNTRRQADLHTAETRAQARAPEYPPSLAHAMRSAMPLNSDRCLKRNLGPRPS